MMRGFWVLIGAGGGLVAGGLLGFGAALVAMSLGPPRDDGTYGVREFLVCLPTGLLLGLILGVVLVLRSRLGERRRPSSPAVRRNISALRS